MFDHLRLARWPFTVVPEKELCNFIADREQIRPEIDRLLRSLSRQSVSSIHPLWSWFGAGKTHTLYYLKNEADRMSGEGISKLLTVYTEFPQNSRTFVDIYRSFVIELTHEVLSEIYIDIYGNDQFEQILNKLSPNLVSALKAMLLGDSGDIELAMLWLRAENLPISDCRKIGISKKITTAGDAIQNLVCLIRMFSYSSDALNHANRTIWLLDELQRIEQLPPRIRDEINTGLHSTFNACPSGFTIILSFSGRPTEKLPLWLSSELKDRIGRSKVMMLPPMQTTDALKFVVDVLKQSRLPEYLDVDPYFPFTKESCQSIIQDIKVHDELKPRAIMQAFHAVLLEADPLIEEKELENISPKFAERVLSEFVEN